MSTVRRSARIAARSVEAEPRPKTVGEKRADAVRAARAAAAAKAAATQYPPDAPPTELVLTIQIPVRRFPAANQEEKNASVRTQGSLLKRLDATHDLSHRLLIINDIFTEMTRQPILLAVNLRFREESIKALTRAQEESKNLPLHHTVLDDFCNVVDEFNEMLGDLPYHPWYVPESNSA